VARAEGNGKVYRQKNRKKCGVSCVDKAEGKKHRKARMCRLQQKKGDESKGIEAKTIGMGTRTTVAGGDPNTQEEKKAER